jgi:hypothetical protein
MQLFIKKQYETHESSDKGTHLPKEHADCKENLHNFCQKIHAHWAEEELSIHF